MNSGNLERLVICDASPLILLAKLGCLDLLTALANEIWIPEAVWREAVTESGPRPEINEIRKRLEHSVVHADPILEAAFRLQVDHGEAAALALVAKNPEACLLIDDARGRAIARLRGWKHVGTLGWLVRARRAGLVPTLKPLFGQLQRDGWYISPALLDKVLADVGEK